MLSANVSERRNDVRIRVVIFESAFLANPFGFDVALVISAPDSIESKIIETS